MCERVYTLDDSIEGGVEVISPQESFITKVESYSSLLFFSFLCDKPHKIGLIRLEPLLIFFS